LKQRHIAAVGVIVALIITAAAIAVLYERGRELPSFPPVSATPADGPAFDDFAGAAACVDCHTTEHADWAASTHGQAGGSAHERSPIVPFDGRPIRFMDGEVVPQRTREGGLRFAVTRPDRGTLTFDVVALVGAGRLVGGGTQGYFMRAVDGSVRLLPWEQTAAGVWFCNTGGRGWQPITAEMRLRDCGDWPPRRVLGGHERLASCQECHGSQFESTVQPDGTRALRWQSLAIDCEACHGPARAHAAAAREGSSDALPSLVMLDKEQSVQLCLRCHALKDALRPGYLAGRPLETHYSVGLPAVSEDALLPDGRTRTFAYQEGHLYSACFLNGGMTCVDCHTPHRQDYRSFNGVALTGRFDDRQCLDCHPSKVDDPTSHTRHAPGSPGSGCVACHMPFLQQPDVGPAVPYARADHTISIPRPALDSLFGIRGACAGCHAELSDTQLAQTVADWYGPLKPLPDAVAALVEGIAIGDRGAPADLADVVERGAQHPMATLTLVGRALRAAAMTEDGARPDRRTTAALLRLAGDEDPDLAAAALALLHLTRGHERRVRAQLVGALVEHPHPGRLRDRWVAILAWIADDLAAQQRPDRAEAIYALALELRPGDATVLRNLGYTQLQRGQTARAVDTFRAAAALAPADALAYVGLGVALTTAGDLPGASRAYSAALRADPYEPLALFNLANAALRAGRYEEAVAGYERVLAVDASLAAASFNLARAHISLGRMSAAAAVLRAGLEFEPENTSAAEILAELQAADSGR
jgi:Flp pilus assembly protein TadD